jgi:glycine dehydrogenase subunit 1
MRYLALTDADRAAMLKAIGAPSIDALYRDVPRAAWHDRPLDLPLGQGEIEIERALGAMAAKNVPASAVPSFLGCGAYRHHIPAAVDYLVQRGEFLTSYTPYQPEIAQGTLAALFEFQTQVALLTAMDVANASLYDGATGAAEAVMMANRLTRRRKSVIAGSLHPQYVETIATYARFNGFEIEIRPPDVEGVDDPAPAIDKDTACVVVQNPSFFGGLADYSDLAARCHAAGALLVVVVTEVVSLGLVKPPGAMDADIVACEGQSLGNPLEFGGPYLGLFATRDKFVRQMPGRLAGETHDAAGRRGFVLTLSAREQHIRREKATSNICTNSGLCALAFTIHLSLLGEQGMTRLAALNHAAAVRLAERLERVPGVRIANKSFFNEFTLALPRPAAPVVDALAKRGILGGVPASRFWPGAPAMQNLLIAAATELNTDDEIDGFAAALADALR